MAHDTRSLHEVGAEVRASKEPCLPELDAESDHSTHDSPSPASAVPSAERRRASVIGRLRWLLRSARGPAAAVAWLDCDDRKERRHDERSPIWGTTSVAPAELAQLGAALGALAATCGPPLTSKPGAVVDSKFGGGAGQPIWV